MPTHHGGRSPAKRAERQFKLQCARRAAAAKASAVAPQEERRALKEERRALEEKERALEELRRGLERRSKGINKAELECREKFHSINEQRRRYNEHRNAACEDLKSVPSMVSHATFHLRQAIKYSSEYEMLGRDAGVASRICAEKASELLGVVGDNKQAAKLCKDLIKQGVYIHQTAENLDERGQHFTRLAREEMLESEYRLGAIQESKWGIQVEKHIREKELPDLRGDPNFWWATQDLRRHRRPVKPYEKPPPPYRPWVE